jgi:mono/diheme cytochrome c family protein
MRLRIIESVSLFCGVSALIAGCAPTPRPPETDLVALGEQIFLTETFDGNGRTCATCHRPTDNFTLSPAFIATLPDDDPLFVAETNGDLAHNFENPRLMRELALILENQDGFDDLENNFNMRGIPHTLALRESIASQAGPRTGWSGDGAPGDGTLRSFATGAVIQHFTRTTNRVAGVDFRLPTERELDALEAFQLSLGRQEDLDLPLRLKGVVAARGQEIFMDSTLGKCNTCHFNAGANADPAVFGAAADNRNFDTGVEDLPDQPADLTGESMPDDDGFGVPGNGEFNTPPLVEAADTGPFFHNNAVATIEQAVGFYDGDAFNESPAGQLLAEATGSSIELDATQIEAVAAFLRVINALENIRSSNELIGRALERETPSARSNQLLERARSETEDAAEVLRARSLHLAAVSVLEQATAALERALTEPSYASRSRLGREAISLQEQARAELVEP